MARPVPSEQQPTIRRRLLVAALMALTLIVLALLAKSSVDRLSVAPWGNLAGDRRSVEIAGKTHVGQQFTAPMPGLYRIEVALKQGSVRSAQPVTFHLKTSPSSTEALWSAKFGSGDVQGREFYGFEFPAMRDSEGQTYYFYFEAPTSTPGDGITVRYGPDAMLDGARAYVNGQAVAGNLKFQTFYSLRTRDKVSLLLARMAEGRPYLFGTKGFYAGLAALYGLILGAFLWQLAQTILEEERS